MKRKKIVLIMILFVLFVNGCVESKKENIVRKNIKRNSSEVKKIINTTKEESDVKELYKKLELNGKLEYRIFQMAMKGFEIISPKQKKYIAIVDFTQNSTKKRFFLIDIFNKSIVYNDLVAHGMNTGEKEAEVFSNEEDSHMSSLGFYVTGEAYYGSNGYSLRLDGLDKGLNDNARKRDIVIHGAPYVSESSIAEMNRIGRSWGCPALSPTISKDVIEKLKDGNLLFVYANNYEKDSTVLRS
mgnify:FL=1